MSTLSSEEKAYEAERDKLAAEFDRRTLPSKEEAKWLADVEQTARSVLHQNRVLPYTKPVELTAEEVLRLVAGYRRSVETGCVIADRISQQHSDGLKP